MLTYLKKCRRIRLVVKSIKRIKFNNTNFEPSSSSEWSKSKGLLLGGSLDFERPPAAENLFCLEPPIFDVLDAVSVYPVFDFVFVAVEV